MLKGPRHFVFWLCRECWRSVSFSAQFSRIEEIHDEVLSTRFNHFVADKSMSGCITQPGKSMRIWKLLVIKHFCIKLKWNPDFSNLHWNPKFAWKSSSSRIGVNYNVRLREGKRLFVRVIGRFVSFYFGYEKGTKLVNVTIHRVIHKLNLIIIFATYRAQLSV